MTAPTQQQIEEDELRSVLLHVRHQGPPAERRRHRDRRATPTRRPGAGRSASRAGRAASSLRPLPGQLSAEADQPGEGARRRSEVRTHLLGRGARHHRQEAEGVPGARPRGLFFQATTTQASEIRFGVIGFMKAFGTPNYWVSGGGLHCGNGAHFMNGIMHVSWSIIPDFAHCNYALNFGCSKGHGAGHVAVQNATQVADARYRGFKNVVFDPFHERAGQQGPRVGADPGRHRRRGGAGHRQLPDQRARHLRRRVPDVQDQRALPDPAGRRPLHAGRGDRQAAGLGRGRPMPQGAQRPAR